MLQRDHRLKFEYERMEHLKSLSPFIEIRSISPGNNLLPDRYEVTFTCKGLIKVSQGLAVSEFHRVLIYLHADYPSQQPRISWLTPIFHPNIKGYNVCLGRSWTPAMTLDELCVILGEMIEYKLYNIEDPLDRDAAKAIERILQQDPNFIPIDSRNLLGPEADFDINLFADNNQNDQVHVEE